MDKERLSVYPYFFLAAYIGIIVLWLYPYFSTGNSTNLDRDFIAFWAASKVTLHGSALDAYVFDRIFEIERLTVTHARKLPWIYPPTYLLMVLPLSWLSYGYALLAFNALTFSGYYVALRKIIALKPAKVIIAFFPGAYICMLYGQNGMLLTSFAGLSLYFLNRRPVLAGLFLGLLSIKPHIAVLFPLLLLYQRNWRAFISAAITVVALALISISAFGLAPWQAFFKNLPLLQFYLESGKVPWDQMISIFALMRLAGISVHLAYLIHIAIALIAVFSMLSIWTRTREFALRAAALILASMLVSPYMYTYDAVLLALPLAWMGLIGQQNGWLKAEREILFLAWTSPLLYFLTDFDFIPVCNLLLLLLISRKVDKLPNNQRLETV